MKKIIFITLLTASLFGLISVLSAQESDRGSIRGSVFQDTNGDGFCQDGTPLPGASIDLELASANTKIRVSTGEDGRYSMTSAAQGTWTLNAFAVNREWGVVSQNPLQVEVSPSAGLFQTGVNFCMQQGVNIPAVIPPKNAANTSSSGATLPEQSAALLSEPPKPIQPAPKQIEKIKNQPVDEEAIPVDTWLGYVNTFREMADVPLVTEDKDLTFGAQSHARYMVVHDRPIAHKEEPGLDLYSEAGHTAGKNGLIFATSQIQADHTWATNFWISAPFHLVAFIDPNLEKVGFGTYNQNVGNFKMAGVIDVRSGLKQPDGTQEYPVMFPADGAETWILRHSLYEWPDSLPSCPGWSRPSGPPIVLMLGEGDIIPAVSRYSVKENGNPLEVCMINETNFVSPNQAEQNTGRTTLNLRDAIVLMPKNPLAINSVYSVEIEANGELHAWSFTTRKRAQKAASE